MNIASEAGTIVTAKTCGCKTANRKVTYAFIEPAHALCLGKKDIIQAEIEACEKLAKYNLDEYDRVAIEKELAELQMALDLLDLSF